MTSDQIADFNARAAAGEKPVMEWMMRGDGSAFAPDVPCVEVQPYGDGRFFIHPDHPARGIRMEWEAWNFDSLPAAQLAAEHLLREASAPLHAKRIEELEEKACSYDTEAGMLSVELDQAKETILRLRRQITGDPVETEREAAEMFHVSVEAIPDPRLAELEAKLAAFGEAWDMLMYGFKDIVAHGSSNEPLNAQKILDEIATLDPRKEKTSG